LSIVEAKLVGRVIILKMSSTHEQAYQSPAWPEFYDLMTERYFGTQPAADAQLFSRILENVLPSFFYTDPVTILDIGAGTGRVILDLLSFIGQDGAVEKRDYLSLVRGGMIGRDYRFIALDNSQAMLDRAMRKISARTESRVEFEVDIVCDSTTHLSKYILPGSIHLAIFAAGSICHLTGDGEVAQFLEELRKVLKQDGRAVVSVLKEFMKIDGEPAKVASVVDKTETLRLPSRDREGEMYVKHPAQQAWKGSVRTDSWKLDIENKVGLVKETHEMSMDARMLGTEEFEILVRKSGFDIFESEEGDVQDWWVLKKTV
jgi:SAM-dependent methyltransferase